MDAREVKEDAMEGVEVDLEKVEEARVDEVMEENNNQDDEEMQDVDTRSETSLSLSDDDDDEQFLLGYDDDELDHEKPLSEEEIEELISEFVGVESKSAEGQEALEKESLTKVEGEVRKELAQTLRGVELDESVAVEMKIFREQWEETLDGLEIESASLLEQLDGAGVELPKLYEMIEKQVPNGCYTEAWKKRAHWVGTPATKETVESLANAENFLHTHRPVRKRHGRLLEEGASGFLDKKFADEGVKESLAGTSELDWSSLNKVFSGKEDEAVSFGSNNWASVYLANTPQQAAEMGLEFPGVNEVEEIEEIDAALADPFFTGAIENEGELAALTEEQKKNYKRVKEEDDINIDRQLQLRLKRKRRQRRSQQVSMNTTENMDDDSAYLDGNTNVPNTAEDQVTCLETSTQFQNNEINKEDLSNSDVEKMVPITDFDADTMRDDSQNNTSMKSSSDSDTDADVNVAIRSKKKSNKKIRRIIDDAELGKETKAKIAIEKERQERLKSLQFSSRYRTVTSMSNEQTVSQGVEVLGDAHSGYIVNVAREIDEEVVRIPRSISSQLKDHQVTGIRFMWENIVQSVNSVKSGDKGLGCILAHTMGLGKTFQVIAFLYTAMRCVDLGFKTALIVTPVNVLHNWRNEFMKWMPSEVKPLRIFMLEDVSRERRLDLLKKWQSKGGVFLLGYASFRNLFLGKGVKDTNAAREICTALRDVPDILVCDEAHIIKNTMADTTQALKQVKCQRRIALTGSPLQNNLMEYYCMVDFVREGFLGSGPEFRNRFQNPIEHGQHMNSTAEDVIIMNQRSHILYEELKGFVQRMDMNVVKNDLPPKTVFVISVKLSPLQRKLYKRFLELHYGISGGRTDEKMRKNFFAAYQVLAQILNHPGIPQLRREGSNDGHRASIVDISDDCSSDENIDCNMDVGVTEKQGAMSDLQDEVDGYLQKDWWVDVLDKSNYKDSDYSGKMVLLLDILSMCAEVGDKALVFSQSIPTLDLIELYLSRVPRNDKQGKFWQKGKDWYRIDGKTESSERQKLVDKFNEPDNKRVKCTLISTRAGSLGVNLYAANRVIIVDGSWNPTYDLQAIYRAWRYGQKKPVFAYRLMALGTIEEKIYKRQVTKEGLAARVVDRQQVHRNISKEEMLHLFEFDENEAADSQNTSQVSDKLMENLLERHNSKWISSFHEHETLLKENEEEKLTKEEKDKAWEVYRRGFECEEVQRVPLTEAPVVVVQEPSPSPPEEPSIQRKRYNRSHFSNRNCTRIAHQLTLISQGKGVGGRALCCECGHVITWEDVTPAHPK